MKRKLWMVLAAAAAASALPCMTASAAGNWRAADGGWQYIREDGTAVRKAWEPVEGEWYYFGTDGMMQTGWKWIGNFPYCFGTDGAMETGWHYFGETGAWYYYDNNHNIRTGWLSEGGKWYWLNPDGTMNDAPEKNIYGEKYWFHEDGSLKASEYTGFSYLDWEGHPAPEYNIRTESTSGEEIFVPEKDREEIGAEISRIPGGWLKKFCDDGWKFIYCPDTEEFFSVKGDNGGRYQVKYKLDSYRQTLRFSDRDSVLKAFGEYVYLTDVETLRDRGFAGEVKKEADRVREVTGLPAYFDTRYQTVFGALFSGYLKNTETEEADGDLQYLFQLVKQSAESRGEDGKPVKSGS